jgi:hypothetical protein
MGTAALRARLPKQLSAGGPYCPREGTIVAPFAAGDDVGDPAKLVCQVGRGALNRLDAGLLMVEQRAAGYAPHVLPGCFQDLRLVARKLFPGFLPSLGPKGCEIIVCRDASGDPRIQTGSRDVGLLVGRAEQLSELLLKRDLRRAAFFSV